MTDLREETHVELARELADLGKRKRQAERDLADITAEVKRVSLTAYRAGMTGRRIIELAGIASRSLVLWAREAGLEPRRSPNGTRKDGRSHQKKRAP